MKRSLSWLLMVLLAVTCLCVAGCSEGRSKRKPKVSGPAVEQTTPPAETETQEPEIPGEAEELD